MAQLESPRDFWRVSSEVAGMVSVMIRECLEGDAKGIVDPQKV